MAPGQFAHGSSYVSMRETVKPKSAKTVPLDPIRRKGIRRRADRQPRMESRVKTGNRGQSRVHRPNRTYPSQRAVLVQRREGPERTDPSLDICINPHCTRVPQSTVHHAVSDCIGVRQPGKRLDDCVWVNAAIGQVQIMARENRQRTIDYAQPERTRAGIDDKDMQANNDTSAALQKRSGRGPSCR